MKILYIVALLCSLKFASFASIDTLKTDTTKTTLTLAAIYSSNANYYGQTTESKLPYLLSNATLRLKNGFFLSAGAYKLINTGSGISAVDLGAGLDFKMTKNLTGVLSYTRSFFPKDSTFSQVASENTASGGINYEWNWFTTDLTADYAFGLEKNIFLTLSNSKLFDLGSLSSKDYISLEPSIQFVGGVSTETIETSGSRRNRNARQVSRRGPRSTTSTSFDLLTSSLVLPLAYNRANYVIETSYQVSSLSKMVAGTTNKPRSFFNLSFYYQF